MKPVMFCRKTQRDAALVRKFDEVGGLLGAFGEQDAVVGEDGDGHPVETREAADEALRRRAA